jgi:hypothetical protein
VGYDSVTLDEWYALAARRQRGPGRENDVADPQPDPGDGTGNAVWTRMAMVADLPFEELLRARSSGDGVLDHCLDRLVSDTARATPEPTPFASAL